MKKKSSLDLKDIEFYTRLSFWKHAMIMEGVYVRYSLGYYGDTDKKRNRCIWTKYNKFCQKGI